MVPVRYEQWTQDDAAKYVPERLKEAKDYRSRFEGSWATNESMLFSNNGSAASEVSVSYDSLAELFAGDMDAGDSAIAINYMFKYLRYIHALMSANPPSVVPRPTSSDYQDRQAAEVADHLVTHARRQYRTQERTDLVSLQTLTYGTGFLKVFHDPGRGEILAIDERTRELTMTGDICWKPLLIWDVFMDPAATVWDDVRYIFLRHIMSREEAEYRFPDQKELIQKYTGQKTRSRFWDRDANGREPKDRVAVFEYIEKALPWNGMAGRRVFLLDDGTLLSDIEANPNPDGMLPIFPMTDVDVPGQVYGKTFVDYLVRLQDVLNRLDSVVLDNIQAHGNVRMVVYDAAESQDGAITDSSWQIVNVKGTAAQKPDFVNPPTLMPDIYRFRDQLIQGMEQLAGVNESMFGQANREMSGFSMQTAINAGNMVRRRLFNKYQDLVEWAYKTHLRLVQMFWTDARKILVTGQEGALAVAYYSGSNIEGGFDLDVQYGASFSLDPASRREEIMQMMPLLKEAGYTVKTILSMLKLNDVAGLFDMADMARRRQLEIFDEMIAKFDEDGTAIYIEPKKLEEHQGMLTAAYEFRMSMVFKVLEPTVQALIEKHIMAREQLMVEAAAPAAGAPSGPAAAGGPPELGMSALPAIAPLPAA